MTPDWEKLGLREPTRKRAPRLGIFISRIWDWDYGHTVVILCQHVDSDPVLWSAGQGQWPNEVPDSVRGFSTIEEAAAHLKRLGCGVEGTQ